MRLNKRHIFDDEDINTEDSKENNMIRFNLGYNEEFINGVNTNQYYGMYDPRLEINRNRYDQNPIMYTNWSNRYNLNPQYNEYHTKQIKNNIQPDLGNFKEKVNRRKKINLEYIQGKNKRNVTFSKRKKGIMKKAYELSVLTGSEILLLVASESGHVYTYATQKLKPIIKDHESTIQKCLNSSKIIQNDKSFNEYTDSDI